MLNEFFIITILYLLQFLTLSRTWSLSHLIKAERLQSCIIYKSYQDSQTMHSFICFPWGSPCIWSYLPDGLVFIKQSKHNCFNKNTDRKTNKQTNASFFPWLSSPQVRILTRYGQCLSQPLFYLLCLNTKI